MQRTTEEAGVGPAEGAVAEVRAVLCPYCGGSAMGGRCDACGGLLDPLSLQATQNQMGPWFIRDPANPFGPGCAYATLRRLAERGRLTGQTVIRGPTTRQFWSFARNVRGVAHLLGECHNCHEPAGADEYMCRSCGAVFEPPRDRQRFGVGQVRLLPGQASAEEVALSARSGGAEPAKSSASAPRVGRVGRDGRASAGGRDKAEAAIQRARRQLRRTRRLVTVSIAVNIVLLAAIVIASLAPRFSIGSGADGGAPTQAEPAAPTPATKTSGAAESTVDLTEARRLAGATDMESLRAAERMLERILGDRAAGAETSEANDLLGKVRARLDEQSLEKVLSADADAGAGSR